MKLFCKMGIHKKINKYESVYKDDNIETMNGWEECKHCQWKSEKHGFTTFGPVKLGISYYKEIKK